MAQTSVLVAEDDDAIAQLVRHHLEAEGFQVALAADGNMALRTARRNVDLAILDVGLPGLDGFEIARILRREGHDLPIVLLTARGDEVDRVVGLELGADDYVTKPFSVRELVARVRGILRRSKQDQPRRHLLVRLGRMEIDECARAVRVDGIDAGLKPREFALLLELAANPGVALSRERLLDRVWGMDFAGDERTVDVHIRRLRQKLQERWELPAFVQTVHSYGYKFIRG
ncbi:MAG: response regulator transcription factor [Vulcanimicrobiaceae bacterium]